MIHQYRAAALAGLIVLSALPASTPDGLVEQFNADILAVMNSPKGKVVG